MVGFFCAVFFSVLSTCLPIFLFTFLPSFLLPSLLLFVSVSVFLSVCLSLISLSHSFCVTSPSPSLSPPPPPPCIWAGGLRSKHVPVSVRLSVFLLGFKWSICIAGNTCHLCFNIDSMKHLKDWCCVLQVSQSKQRAICVSLYFLWST